MKIQLLKNGDVKITPETNIDIEFWHNIKKTMRENDATIMALKREVNQLSADLSYYKKERNVR